MKKSFNNLPLLAIISLFLMISVNKVTLSQPPAPPQDSFGSQFNNSGKRRRCSSHRRRHLDIDCSGCQLWREQVYAKNGSKFRKSAAAGV
jgi:hypothetical protein